MGKVVGGRTIKEYVAMIKMPLMALIGLVVIYFLVSLIGLFPSMFFAGLRGIVNLISLVIVLVMGAFSIYLGYNVAKNYRGNLMTALYAGAIGGVIVGEAMAVLEIIWGLLALVLLPSSGIAKLILGIIGIVLFPISGAIIGGILAIIGGGIAGSSSNESASKNKLT